MESLLYFAPQIINSGRTLASAVATARQRLLGLGDFFGDSWPDQPFRDSYPRSQYAMLIIARQLADEIQGIGGGIEQMARAYGIAENHITADITRIQANQGRIASLINHTGGLPPPPDNPLGFPVPRAPRPVAHPQPQPNPPASAPPPAAPQTSHASPAPDPQPGYDPTAWHPSDSTSMLGPWPSGDPARMEEAAGYWNGLTLALEAAWNDLQRYTAYILADAQGAAADAFSNYVDGLTGTGHGSLTRAIQASQDLHDVCLRQATEIRVLKRTLEQAAIEFLAGLILGQVVSLLTFESTQALSDAVDAGLAARLTALAAQFAEEGTRLGELLDTAAVGLSKAVSAALASGLQSGVMAEVDLEANNLIGRAFGQKPASGAAALLDFLEAGGLGAIAGQGSAGGLLSLSAGAASKKLIDLGEVLKDSEGTDARTGEALIAVGRQLKQGGLTVSAANAAATELIAKGGVTPVTFFSSAISNRFTTLISPHTGAHVAG